MIVLVTGQKEIKAQILQLERVVDLFSKSEKSCCPVPITTLLKMEYNAFNIDLSSIKKIIVRSAQVYNNNKEK